MNEIDPVGTRLMRGWLGATLRLALPQIPEYRPWAVSARLSRSLHQALGDEGADDLVNWMVRVEANRSELNDVMSAWRVATEAKFDTIDARFDAVVQRFDTVDQRFAAVDQRFNAVDRRLEGIERRLENIDNRMTDVFKWSFVFWLGSVGVFAGLVRLMK